MSKFVGDATDAQVLVRLMGGGGATKKHLPNSKTLDKLKAKWAKKPARKKPR